MLIDDKGRFFGKINIIDCLVGILLISFIPIIYYGFVMLNKPNPNSNPIILPPTQYTMSYTCPICSKQISIGIDFGEKLEKNHLVECGYCKNKVVVNKSEPNLTYQEQYYRFMLENKQR